MNRTGEGAPKRSDGGSPVDDLPEKSTRSRRTVSLRLSVSAPVTPIPRQSRLTVRPKPIGAAEHSAELFLPTHPGLFFYLRPIHQCEDVSPFLIVAEGVEITDLV